jgi:hypothetical protein
MAERVSTVRSPGRKQMPHLFKVLELRHQYGSSRLKWVFTLSDILARFHTVRHTKRINPIFVVQHLMSDPTNSCHIARIHYWYMSDRVSDCVNIGILAY